MYHAYYIYYIIYILHILYIIYYIFYIIDTTYLSTLLTILTTYTFLLETYLSTRCLFDIHLHHKVEPAIACVDTAGPQYLHPRVAIHIVDWNGALSLMLRWFKNIPKLKCINTMNE